MKTILTITALIIGLAISGQDNYEIIIGEFERLNGNWDGFMEYTDDSDNKTRYSMPARCQTTYNGKKWEYAVQYDEGNGEMAGGKGECTVSKDGAKMNYDGVIWDITKVEETGDTTTIVLETTGKENRKKAALKRTMIITSTTFNILEQVSYIEENAGYITRSKHIFRRKMQ